MLLQYNDNNIILISILIVSVSTNINNSIDITEYYINISCIISTNILQLITIYFKKIKILINILIYSHIILE